MAQATALLLLALSLLHAASSPNVTPELKNQAISVATAAIQYAEASMTATTTPDVLPVATTTPVTTEPALGSSPADPLPVASVFPIPSCTLTATSTLDVQGGLITAFDWTSLNAKSGKIMGSFKLRWILLDANTVASGHADNFNVAGPYTFTVTGDGGTTTCTAT